MKMPNFRLHETQAQASLLFGLLACLSAAVLCVLVFWNFDPEMRVIPYSAVSTFGRYRKILVAAGTAITVGIAVIAGMLGFNSLGQKRNSRQGLSWIGLIIAAVTLSSAIVLFVAWMELSQPIITSR